MIEFSHRYDYYGVDALGPNGNPQGDAIVLGTKQECYQVLCGILHGMELMHARFQDLCMELRPALEDERIAETYGEELTALFDAAGIG